MLYQIVAIRDKQLGVYSRPFFVASVGQALRSFQDEANRKDPQNDIHNHPADFDLWHIGRFDDNSGLFTNIEGGAICLATAVQLKE